MLCTKRAVITPTITKKASDQVCLDIGMFFLKNEIAFNVVDSSSFVNMLDHMVKAWNPLIDMNWIHGF